MYLSVKLFFHSAPVLEITSRSIDLNNLNHPRLTPGTTFTSLIRTFRPIFFHVNSDHSWKGSLIIYSLWHMPSGLTYPATVRMAVIFKRRPHLRDNALILLCFGYIVSNRSLFSFAVSEFSAIHIHSSRLQHDYALILLRVKYLPINNRAW